MNLNTGAVTKGPDLVADSGLVPDGRALYVVSPTALSNMGATVGPFLLRSVALASMALGPAVSLGDSLGFEGSRAICAQTSGSHMGELWVATEQELKLISPTTGVAVLTASLPEGDYQVATEPDGSYVDVSINPSTESLQPEVLEFEASNGALIATRSRMPAVSGPELTEVPGGVWASYRTGMLGTSIKLAEPSLRYEIPAKRATNVLPAPDVAVGMGEEATLAGNVLFLTDLAGVSCLAATGNRVLASERWPGNAEEGTQKEWIPFGALNGTVYATTGPAVIAVHVPRAC
ncbi:MAG: hypothetical protein ACLPQS_08580 [Acidimicrobiales bacterium]